jgi:hypothetical protein
MVINFKAHEINRDACKLAWISTFKKKKRVKSNLILTYFYHFQPSMTQFNWSGIAATKTSPSPAMNHFM